MKTLERPDRSLIVIHRDECFEVCARNQILDAVLNVHEAFTMGPDGAPDFDQVRELDKVAKRLFGIASHHGYIDFTKRKPESQSMKREVIYAVSKLFNEGRV